VGKLLGVPMVRIYEKKCMQCGKEFQIFRKWGVSMMAEWRQLSTIAKIFHFGGLISFIGLPIMVLTGMTSIGAMWELLKRCLLCMWPDDEYRRSHHWTAIGSSR
jgi:hypothetical protein